MNEQIILEDWQKELIEEAGIEVSEVIESMESDSFDVEFDELRGVRFFDPFRQVLKDQYIGSSGWTYWSND